MPLPSISPRIGLANDEGQALIAQVSSAKKPLYKRQPVSWSGTLGNITRHSQNSGAAGKSKLEHLPCSNASILELPAADLTSAEVLDISSRNLCELNAGAFSCDARPLRQRGRPTEYLSAVLSSNRG